MIRNSERSCNFASRGGGLGEREIDFISRRDRFYMASVSETDWPYVQHRGGPVGFLKALSPSRVGFADWNCPQHITPRFTEAEIETAFARLRTQLTHLEAKLRFCPEST